MSNKINNTMKNPTLSITMADMMSSVVEMMNQCYSIFDEHGGYNYNDDMLYQLQGLRESIGECANEEDWKGMVTEASTTLMWFEHIEKIRKLEDSIPDSLYC